MNEYKPIPVSIAHEIADRFEKSMVVILAYDPAHALTHTTTYGRSSVEKVIAAEAGEIVTKAVGGDLDRKTPFEDFRHRSEAEAAERIEKLADALRAVLLMHSAEPWTEERQAEWARVVGGEATYTRMCDHIRKVLAEAGIKEDRGDGNR